VLRLWWPQSFIVSDGTWIGRKNDLYQWTNGLIQGKKWEKTYGLSIKPSNGDLYNDQI